MRAGLLNQVITLLKPLKERDELGSEVITWEKFKDIKASISYSASDKSVVNDEIVANNFITCTVRIYQEITLDMRVESHGILYNVESVYPDYSKQIKVIQLTEVNE